MSLIWTDHLCNLIYQVGISMALSEQNMLKELKTHGITSLDDLVKKIAEQSTAKANYERTMGHKIEPEYFWTGKNYTIYHPED